MGDRLLDRLAEIRNLQGKDAMPDPTVIQGFESGSTPPPEWTPPISTQEPDDGGFDSATEAYDDAYDDNSSPLVPPSIRKVATAATATPIRPEPPPQYSLLIVDNEAGYKGYAVTLNADELRSVAAIVIGASRRVLDEHAKALTSGPQKMVVAPGDPDAGQGRAKRGRPRKAKA